MVCVVAPPLCCCFSVPHKLLFLPRNLAAVSPSDRRALSSVSLSSSIVSPPNSKNSKLFISNSFIAPARPLLLCRAMTMARFDCLGAPHHKNEQLGVQPLDGAPVGSSLIKTPVLLFDVMGTIVRDPFYQDVPAFFGISFKELLAIKHPTAWIEFEEGLITEEELVSNFFLDKRDFDSRGLKKCMENGYTYLEGVEPLLGRLKSRGYQLHAFTNYPSWYDMIEDKLKLSKYLTWTFVSCHTGKRKPDPEAYVDAAKHLNVSPSDIIFIDDQSRNVEAANQTGMTGLAFESAAKLEQDLLALGILF